LWKDKKLRKGWKVGRLRRGAGRGLYTIVGDGVRVGTCEKIGER
jgi:hypothetical protein